MDISAFRINEVGVVDQRRGRSKEKTDTSGDGYEQVVGGFDSGASGQVVKNLGADDLAGVNLIAPDTVFTLHNIAQGAEYPLQDNARNDNVNVLLDQEEAV